MPTPSFCALEEVYSDWNFKKPVAPPNLLQPNNQGQNLRPPAQPVQQPHQYPQLHPIQRQDNQNEAFQQDEDTAYVPNNNGLRSFCPNCQNCTQANDVLQQRIIEQNIWPRPRWTPQYPNAYVPYDPFNRYWMNNVPQSHREDFGNVFENFGKGSGNGNNMSTETLLQVILFILIALFIIQLIECLYMRCTE